MPDNRRILLGAMSALFLLIGCDEPSHTNESVRPVLSMTVKEERTEPPRLAGTVEARVESGLSFQTLGRVISRKVEVGDSVHKGEVLAELDPLTLQLAVASAEADLRNARARLDNALLTEKRRRALAAVDAMSQENLDIAEEAASSARAAVAQAEARLVKVREQSGYAKLTARFDGIITGVSVEKGQIVPAGQTAIRLARPEARDVIVDMPGEQATTLRPGSRFSVLLQIDETMKTSGELREISPQADASTRTRRLKISINGAPDVFRLGTVVTVMPMEAPSSANTVLLPATAIHVRNKQHFVWVIAPSDHTVSLRAVKTETVSGGASQVRVVDGLHEGEEVAIAGVNVLMPGQKVRIERTTNL
ncbi:efflux RND transporter periplasmic adaptor subunit [Pectobacterium sp. B2J-2]|uniref:efflux RND transporter periplasmic adaptor subunit n=1 Tax=Pectobacterium sp. B2J-2 TaxID=3385372 RepID=UPI0038FC8E3D